MAKVKLGTKYDCYSCGTKFYDLGKPQAICPSCGADQQNPDAAADHDVPRRVTSVNLDDSFVDPDDEIAGAIDLDDDGFGGLEEEEDLDDLDEE